jgi:hypothetical protein
MKTERTPSTAAAADNVPTATRKGKRLGIRASGSVSTLAALVKNQTDRPRKKNEKPIFNGLSSRFG